MLIGCKQDPDFGPLILFGAGGVFAEVLEDVMVDLPPLNLLLARRLIEKTRVARVLRGDHKLPPANLDLLSEILVRLSQLVTDFPEIIELDINPLSVISGRFVGVDARMVVRPASVPAPRHLIIAPFPSQYEKDWMMRVGSGRRYLGSGVRWGLEMVPAHCSRSTCKQEFHGNLPFSKRSAI